MLQGAPAPVVAWAIVLCLVSALNVWIWRILAAGEGIRAHAAGGGGAYGLAERRYRRRQLVLSGLFVAGCAFRSVLPRADVQRICLHDTWLSAVFVGRAVATIAELALVSQWALLLWEAGRAKGLRSVAVLAALIVPLIATAEVWSWYATLTTNYLGNAFEESTWAAVALVALIACALLWVHDPSRRRYLGSAMVLLSAYFVFMCAVDVPMYAFRHQADERAGRKYLSLREGVRDAMFRRVVTTRWEDWGEEIPWMTLYFSSGVWVSLALVRAPRFRNG